MEERSCDEVALRSKVGCAHSDSQTCLYAGNLECLKYADENGCEWNATIRDWIATYGFSEWIKYARENIW